MDPPTGTAYQPKVRENGEKSGAFLDGINRDFLHMEEVVKPDLFNKVMDMYITVAEVKNKVERFFEACKDAGCVPMLYYTGHGQRGTGNWCFADGVLSFSDIHSLLPPAACALWIFADCGYSGHWANLARVSYDGSMRVVAAVPHFMTALDIKDKGGDFTYYITGHQDAGSLARPLIYSGHSETDYPLPTSVRSYPYCDRVVGEIGERFILTQHFYKNKWAVVWGHSPGLDRGAGSWAVCTRSSYESLLAWIKEQWEKGLRVVHCSCDGKQFGACAIKGLGTEQSVITGTYSHVVEHIRAKWQEGLRITSVCPGIEHDWVVFMTKCGGRWGVQWCDLKSSWSDVKERISEVWKMGGIITALAVKKNAWFLVMTESSRAQKYVWGPEDGTFPNVNDDNNFNLTSTSILKHPQDGRWLVIGTGGLNAGVREIETDLSI